MKDEEVEERKENGRHERKSNEAVMLLKKFKHDEDEKFCVMIPSKAWGKGVGSVGEEEGTVGKVWDTTGTEDEVVDDGEADDGDADDGVADSADDEDTIDWGFGSLFHQDWWDSSPYHEGEEKTGADFRKRLLGMPPQTVNSITKNGIRITAHRNRLPARRFVSCEFRESTTLSRLWWGLVEEGLCVVVGAEMSNTDGWGEGGGVNMEILFFFLQYRDVIRIVWIVRNERECKRSVMECSRYDEES